VKPYLKPLDIEAGLGVLSDLEAPRRRLAGNQEVSNLLVVDLKHREQHLGRGWSDYYGKIVKSK